MICARECSARANQSVTRMRIARPQISKCMIFRHPPLPVVEFFLLVARTCFVRRPPVVPSVATFMPRCSVRPSPWPLPPRRCYLASFVLRRRPLVASRLFFLRLALCAPYPAPLPSLRARDLFAHDINARLRAIYVKESVARRVDSRARESALV